MYDSNGGLLVFNDDTTTTGGVVVETNFRIPRTLAPGVYYFGVFSAVRGGDRGLHLARDGRRTTDTPLAHLRPWRWGIQYRGASPPDFDRDVFKLDLSGASGTTDVWIYTTGDLDTLGSLYDSNGDLLVYNDDSYIEGRRTNFSLRRNLPRGVYYIDVLSWDGAIGDYTLHTEAVTDPGSATGTATILNLDSPTPGKIGTASDSDYFRLVLADSKNLVIYALSSGLYYRTPDLLGRYRALFTAMFLTMQALRIP